jgi:hypothetical protein
MLLCEVRNDWNGNYNDRCHVRLIKGEAPPLLVINEIWFIKPGFHHDFSNDPVLKKVLRQFLTTCGYNKTNCPTILLR